MNWLKELETAQSCAIEAGKAIMEIYNHFTDLQVEYKADHSPLTAADKAANRMLVDALRREFPTYAFLSEEKKDNRTRL